MGGELALVALLGGLALVQALVGVWAMARARGALAQGEANAQTQGYTVAMGSNWLGAIAVLAVWIGTGRTITDLGLRLPDGLLQWGVTGLLAVLSVLFYMQNARAADDPEAVAKFREQQADLGDLLPHDARAHAGWIGVSITSGITEEVVYRGFAFALLIPLVGTWAALALSMVPFGLIHLYQGPKAMVRNGLLGAILGGLYLLSGSLIGPMLFHAAANLAAGRVGLAAFGDPA